MSIGSQVQRGKISALSLALWTLQSPSQAFLLGYPSCSGTLDSLAPQEQRFFSLYKHQVPAFALARSQEAGGGQKGSMPKKHRVPSSFALQLFWPSPVTKLFVSLSSLFSSININTGKSRWEKPKLKRCKLLQELPDKIVDLANITISDGKTVLHTLEK